LCQTPGNMMLLKHEHRVATFGKRCGAGKSADARTYDDDIPRISWRHQILPV